MSNLDTVANTHTHTHDRIIQFPKKKPGKCSQAQLKLNSIP